MADIITLVCGADEVRVHLHGATVLSYVHNGNDSLFVSSQAKLDGSKAIRGGIPIVFPNFGPWSPGPQHGFARISKWKNTAKEEGSELSWAKFQMENSELTEKMWPHRFCLTYKVTLNSTSLVLSLTISNKNETESFDYTVLLHTYFRVGDVSKVGVTNLTNLKYNDKLRGGEEFVEKREIVDVIDGADRVYKETENIHEIRTHDEPIYSLMKENFPDTVVWNPWQAGSASMSDFGDTEYTNMICVEAGSVGKREVLAPGQSKTFNQTIQAL